jgi:hypothetical protein
MSNEDSIADNPLAQQARGLTRLVETADRQELTVELSYLNSYVCTAIVRHSSSQVAGLNGYACANL